MSTLFGVEDHLSCHMLATVRKIFDIANSQYYSSSQILTWWRQPTLVIASSVSAPLALVIPLTVLSSLTNCTSVNCLLFPWVAYFPAYKSGLTVSHWNHFHTSCPFSPFSFYHLSCTLLGLIRIAHVAMPYLYFEAEHSRWENIHCALIMFHYKLLCSTSSLFL